MNRRRKYAFLIGFICSMAMLLLALSWHLKNRQRQIVTLHDLVQERVQFEASRPLKSKDPAERFAEFVERSRMYASTSAWEGKWIIVEGFWEGPYEGISISSKPSGRDREVLMMRAAPDFGENKFSLARFLPNILLRKKAFVSHGDYVRSAGIYHGTGYGKPGSLLENSAWLDFHEVERWNHQRASWEAVGGW